MNDDSLISYEVLVGTSQTNWICPLMTTCRNETHEVIKYLEYCVHRLQNEDPGVHNLLLSLYSKQVHA